MQILWFRSYNGAVSYAANAGLKQKPQKRPVWLDLAWQEIWSLDLDLPSESPATSPDDCSSC